VKQVAARNLRTVPLKGSGVEKVFTQTDREDIYTDRETKSRQYTHDRTNRETWPGTFVHTCRDVGMLLD
jgi:hypothetical protein